MAGYRKKPVVIEAFGYGIDNRPEWFLDKVIMHTCGEFDYYKGRIWISSTDEWIQNEGEGSLEQRLVFLEGFGSWFLIKKPTRYPVRNRVYSFSYGSVNISTIINNELNFSIGYNKERVEGVIHEHVNKARLISSGNLLFRKLSLKGFLFTLSL
ncbi:hypothetical protein JDS87_16705 [Bacillus cereus]|uniref:hypothetical protein n=1 Tax=Bacillus cereus TaxID=1396 RepID=UPI0018F7A139|nr:hypothetical protein [Bacillus cereus]MBJ8053561.1 hypothetical protein [Bacillus cereus]